MKYCSQCGQRLDDGDIFCPNCGAQQADEAAAAEAPGAEPTPVWDGGAGNAAYDNGGRNDDFYPVYSEQKSEYSEAVSAYGADTVNTLNEVGIPKKKKKRTGLIIGLAAAALAVLGIVALMVTGAYASLLPHSRLKLGLAEKKLFSAISESEAVTRQPVDNMDFTLDLDFETNDGLDYYTEEIIGIFENVAVSGSYDVTDGASLALKVKYKNNTALDGMLISDDEKVGVYLSPASDKFYTITNKALLQKLFPDADIDDCGALIETPDPALLKKDAAAILGIIGKSLESAEIVITKNVPTVLFKGTDSPVTCDCAVYTVILNEQQVTVLLNSIADYLDSDECYVKSLFNNNPLLRRGMASSGDFEDIDNVSFSDLIARFRRDIPEAAKSYVEDGYRFEAVMKGNSIVRQRFYNKEGGVCYDSLENGNTLRVFGYAFDNDEEDYLGSFDSTVVTNGKAKQISIHYVYDEDLSYDIEGVVNMANVSVLGNPECDFTYVMHDGYYDDEVKMHMKSTPVSGGDSITMRIEFTGEMAEYSGMDAVTANLGLSAGTRVEIPAGVETEDISEYSDMKLYMLLMTLSNNLGSSLEGLFD